MSTQALDLAALLAPIDPEAFFRDCWEKQPLAVGRGDPAYYHGLLRRADLDGLLAFTRPKFIGPDSFDPAPPRRNTVQGLLADEEPTPAVFYPDLLEVRRAFAAGKTLVLSALQHRHAPAAALCRGLEAHFGCAVHANLYFTPPGAQGFAAHYDPHEVFVLQIDGRKHWRLYGGARELPLAADTATFGKDQLGPPTQEVLLEPGDLLYVPRGHAHEAFTAEGGSMHLTLGVKVFRWVDLLQQALDDLAARDVRLRRTLPTGLLGRGTPPPGLGEDFRDLLRHFAGQARLDEAVAGLAESFVGKLASLPCDAFAPDEADAVGLDTPLEHAPGVFCRVVPDGPGGVALLAPGARVSGPARIAPALHFVARHRRLTPRQLPEALSPDARVVLARRLVGERVLKVVS
jgi:hypothetical protein